MPPRKKVSVQMAKSEKRKDLETIAKLIYNFSKKYGNIYTSADCCENSDHSAVTYKGNGKYKRVTYWGNEKKFSSLY